MNYQVGISTELLHSSNHALVSHWSINDTFYFFFISFFFIPTVFICIYSFDHKGQLEELRTEHAQSQKVDMGGLHCVVSYYEHMWVLMLRGGGKNCTNDENEVPMTIQH